jgi:hypothetical protein
MRNDSDWWFLSLKYFPPTHLELTIDWFDGLSLKLRERKSELRKAGMHCSVLYHHIMVIKALERLGLLPITTSRS